MADCRIPFSHGDPPEGSSRRGEGGYISLLIHPGARAGEGAGTKPKSGTAEYTRASCVRLVRRENIPALPASDRSAARIYPRFLRPIGPPQEYTRASCVRLVRRENIPTLSASD
eukprot:1176253-Prorocentrum_minimum.AAC.1